jgi:hypothetical protein
VYSVCASHHIAHHRAISHAQELERARLLADMVRRREVLKGNQLRCAVEAWSLFYSAAIGDSADPDCLAQLVRERACGGRMQYLDYYAHVYVSCAAQ